MYLFVIIIKNCSIIQNNNNNNATELHNADVLTQF